MGNRLLREVINQLNRIERKLDKMAQREEAAYARQTELIRLVKDGSDAKDAKIRVLEQLVRDAQEITDSAVRSALDEDSEFDAARLEAGNEALDELVATEEQPPPRKSSPSDLGIKIPPMT